MWSLEMGVVLNELKVYVPIDNIYGVPEIKLATMKSGWRKFIFKIFLIFILIESVHRV